MTIILEVGEVQIKELFSRKVCEEIIIFNGKKSICFTHEAKGIKK